MLRDERTVKSLVWFSIKFVDNGIIVGRMKLDLIAMYVRMYVQEDKYDIDRYRTVRTDMMDIFIFTTNVDDHV